MHEGGDITFGQWLKRRRKERDLTQAELAWQVGCSVVMIAKLESDARRPSKQIAERIADQLEIGAEHREAFIRFARSTATDAAPTPEGPSLPQPLGPLIGREREVAELSALIASGQQRLITVWGPGGVGKSRLALAAAESLTGRYQSMHWIALADIEEPQQLLPTIAAALGCEPDTAALEGALGGGPRLLILDTFEHLLAAAPAIIALLGACHQLTVVVTSRAPLAVRGEQRMPLGPLALPSPAQTGDLATLERVPSVALFIAHMRHLVPGYTLRPAQALAVATLCRRLDGLPLAIELLAQRCRIIEPQVLLECAQSAPQQLLDLLGSGPTDLAPRLRDLRSLVAWSCQRVSPLANHILTQLAASTCGWTLHAALQACSDPHGQQLDAATLINGLQELYDASLIQRVEHAGLTTYVMLNIVRAFALDSATPAQPQLARTLALTG